MSPFCGVGLYLIAFALREAFLGQMEMSQVLSFGFMGLLCGGAGLLVIIASMKGYEFEKHQEERRSRNPDEPWLWRDDWAAGLIKGSNQSVILIWLAALVLNLIVTPYSLSVVGIVVLERGDVAALIILMFPLAGAVFLVWAIRATLHRNKFGTSFLKLETLPGVIGGHLKGVIRIPVALLLEEDPLLILTCTRRTSIGSNSDSDYEKILWQERQVIRKERIKAQPHGSSIPFTFDIPYKVEETDRETVNNPLLWHLEAAASVPGVDYEAKFQVPVFRTQESDPEFVPGREAEAPQAAASLPSVDYQAQFQVPLLRTQKGDPQSVPAGVSEVPQQVAEHLTRRGGNGGIDVRPGRRGGTEFYFAPARNVGFAACITGFTLIWSYFTWITLTKGAPIIFPIVFSALNVFLFYAVLHFWLGVSKVLIRWGNVTVTRGFLWLGIPTRIPRSPVQDTKISIGGQAGSTAYYNIYLIRNGKRKICLGYYIKDKRQAEWLAETMKEKIKGRTGPTQQEKQALMFS